MDTLLKVLRQVTGKTPVLALVYLNSCNAAFVLLIFCHLSLQTFTRKCGQLHEQAWGCTRVSGGLKIPGSVSKSHTWERLQRPP